MTVPISPIPDKEQSVEYFREIAGSAHIEFTSRFNRRTSCGSLNMPNYDVRQDAIIDPKLADAILFFPPVTLMEQICKIKFGKPLFITGGISQLMMWSGLPVTITNNKDEEVFQFDDRCSRDVDMKTVLTSAEFSELVEIVLEIYKDIDGWVVENKQAQSLSYPKLEFRQLVDGEEVVRAQVFNIESIPGEECETAFGRYMKDNATPYYQTGIMFDSFGVKIADPNGCIPDKFSEFERNLPSVKFKEYFPDVVELALVGENPNGKLSPHQTYWAIKTALIYMAQAKYIYGLGITDLNPDIYRRLISNLNNGIFDNVFTTEDKEYIKRMTWRTAIEMMANIDTDQRDYFGSKHPIAEFFLGVPPLMQYLLPTLTQRLLGNLTIPNINSLNYERQFQQQIELIKDEDELSELLVQHKTAYIFTMGLHLYRNNFVDINQVIAWLLVSAQLARQSVAIDGVPIGNSSIDSEIDFLSLLEGYKICSFEAIDGVPQYVSVQNPGVFLHTQQFTEISPPIPNRTHGILKTNGNLQEYYIESTTPNDLDMGSHRYNFFASKGIMLRKRFGVKINPILINQMYRLSISDINWRNLGVFQEHMYHETLKTMPDIPTVITEIPNFSTTAGLGIYDLLTTPGNNYYKSIKRILSKKHMGRGIIATI